MRIIKKEKRKVSSKRMKRGGLNVSGMNGVDVALVWMKLLQRGLKTGSENVAWYLFFIHHQSC